MIATGPSIRDLPRLRKVYGNARWRKLKGVAHVRFGGGSIRLAEVHWYEAHGLGKKELEIKRFLTDMLSQTAPYLVCIRNDGVPASLEVRKIYQSLHDPDANRSNMVRVIDESGEDYLYPKDWFVTVEPSVELLSALQVAS